MSSAISSALIGRLPIVIDKRYDECTPASTEATGIAGELRVAAERHDRGHGDERGGEEHDDPGLDAWNAQ